MINKNPKKKIKNTNLSNINTLYHLNDAEIQKILDLTPESTIQLKKEISTGKHILWLKEDIEKISKKSNPLSSGSTNLDFILNGGFFPGVVYFIFGEFTTGKTQLCLQLATNIAQKFNEQLIKKNQYLTLFLDTENNFKPERINQLSTSLNLEPERVLKSINVLNIIGSTALNVTFEKIEDLIKTYDYKLVIIDSLTNHFRADQNNESMNQITQVKKFLKILKKINELTKKYNLISILIGQVSPNFSKESFFPVKPFAVRLLNHSFSEFIFFSYVEDNKRSAHIINSEFLPERKTIFMISEKGIRDYHLISKN